MKHTASIAAEYIGWSLKEKRKRLGVTGEEIAKKLNISQQQVSRYERGVNTINISMLIRFFDVLEMDEDDISYVFDILVHSYSEYLKVKEERINLENCN
ncbi:helix-turn-helix transcriptional regulator [Proteus mirabilis]|nr:helix-turn-helix transcriptional regulator [Proteus mirabilis]